MAECKSKFKRFLVLLLAAVLLCTGGCYNNDDASSEIPLLSEFPFESTESQAEPVRDVPEYSTIDGSGAVYAVPDDVFLTYDYVRFFPNGDTAYVFTYSYEESEAYVGVFDFASFELTETAKFKAENVDVSKCTVCDGEVMCFFSYGAEDEEEQQGKYITVDLKSGETSSIETKGMSETAISHDMKTVYYIDSETEDLMSYSVESQKSELVYRFMDYSSIWVKQFIDEVGIIEVTAFESATDKMRSIYFDVNEKKIKYVTETTENTVICSGNRYVVANYENRSFSCFDSSNPRQSTMLGFDSADEIANCRPFFENGAVLSAYSETKGGNELHYLNKYSLSNGLQQSSVCVQLEREGGSYSFDVANSALDSEGRFAVVPYSFFDDNDMRGLNETRLAIWDTSVVGNADNGGEYFSDESLLSGRREDEVLSAEIHGMRDEIEEEYGVSIYIGEEVDREFIDYDVQCIYDEENIADALEVFDNTFKLYPDGFFGNLTYGRIKKVSFYLGGTLTATSDLSLESAAAFACESGTEQMTVYDITYIATLRDTIVHELSHSIDNRITYMVGEDMCDFSEEEWMTFNPSGFDYTYSYVDLATDFEYTMMDETSNDRIYFIDDYSKNFPTEDRARLMEYLLMDETVPDYFASEHLQEKLNYFFDAIRQSFDCENWGETEWERRLASVS